MKVDFREYGIAEDVIFSDYGCGEEMDAQKNWASILAQLAIYFKERVESYL